MRTLCMLDNFATNKTMTMKRFTPKGWRRKSDELDASKNKTTGTTVKNFLVAVN